MLTYGQVVKENRSLLLELRTQEERNLGLLQMIHSEEEASHRLQASLDAANQDLETAKQVCPPARMLFMYACIYVVVTHIHTHVVASTCVSLVFYVCLVVCGMGFFFPPLSAGSRGCS